MAVTLSTVQANINRIDLNHNGMIDTDGYNKSLFLNREGKGSISQKSQNNASGSAGGNNWWNESEQVYTYIKSVINKLAPDAKKYVSMLNEHLRGMLEGYDGVRMDATYGDVAGIPIDQTELSKFTEDINELRDVDPKYRKDTNSYFG